MDKVRLTLVGVNIITLWPGFKPVKLNVSNVPVQFFLTDLCEIVYTKTLQKHVSIGFSSFELYFSLLLHW